MRWRRLSWTRTWIPVLALAALSPPAASAEPQAETTEPQAAAVEQRVARLEQLVQQLRAGYEARVGGLERQLVQLQAEVATLQARLEALEQAGATAAARPGVAAAPGGQPAGAGVQAESEAAERAALQAEIERALAEAAGNEEGTGGAAPAGQTATDQGRRFEDRARNLRRLNPEISVTGDMFGVASDRSGDPENNRFEINEFEAAFQAPLDPFSQAKAFVVFEDGEFDLEEMYVEWTTLPGNLGIKAGRFRNDFGKINRWHQHALSQVDRPAVHRAFLGEEGLAGLGVSVSWLMPTLFGDYNELWVQVTNDDNDVAFSGRGFDTPVVTVHETNYWDLSPSTYFELGLSASTGVNDPDGRHRTWVAGADFNLNWSPPAEALYKGFELRGELLYERRKQEQGSTESWGAYLYGTRKLNQRWHLGLRLDWTQLPREPGEELWGVSPYVEFWQSEWARLRMQYSYGSRGIEDRRHENRFFFQVTWALGPHKHEKY